MSSIHPFDHLKALVQRVHEHAAPLPERSTKDDAWQAVAFQIDDAIMLVNMSSVSEVFPQPPVTRLPGVQRWVRGIANVRGEVLTVVDLHEFFELGGTRNPAFNRVIALEKGDIRLGVVVDRIVGMRQIAAQETKETPSEGCPEAMKSCVSGAILIDDDWMDIFDPEKLITNKNFLNVSTL